jgi:hypothetical protein
MFSYVRFAFDLIWFVAFVLLSLLGLISVILESIVFYFVGLWWFGLV